MLDVIPKWKTKKKILEELQNEYNMGKINERYFRKLVENFNKEYQEHLTDEYFIAHSHKGYKITKDHELMKQTDKDLTKRALNMLWKVSQRKRARGEDNNMYWEDVINDIKEQQKSPSVN